MSAAFKVPSRALGNELYRGSMAYLTEINRAGGVHGRSSRLAPHKRGATKSLPWTSKTWRLTQKKPTITVSVHLTVSVFSAFTLTIYDLT